MLLKFAKGNAKVGPNVWTFSLPSGRSCPFANECLSKSKREEDGIEDGPNTLFRCFSASQEAQYPKVREKRWYNFDLLRAAGYSERMGELISRSIRETFWPKQKTPTDFVVRVHDSGDFFSGTYMLAWINVAAEWPQGKFYFYTKSLMYWKRFIEYLGDGYTPGLLRNMVPTASYGGRNDNLIGELGLRYARVIGSEDEANELDLEIDHDDTHAQNHGNAFALLIHGTQPKGSEMGKKLQTLRKRGFSGYSKNIRLIW